MLFSLAEIKIIQSNNGVFKNFAINQSESSIIIRNILSFSDIINQNRAPMVMEFPINLMSTNQS